MTFFIHQRHTRACRAFLRQLIIVAAAALVLPVGARTQAAAGGEARLGTQGLDTLRTENARLAARVDSLREELRQHRIAENFVSTALEEQANRFSVIVGLAVAAVGAFTFVGILWRFRRTRRYLTTKMKAVEAQLANAEAFMHRAAANAYVAIASIYRDSSPGLAVAASLLAAGNFYAIQSGAPERSSRLGAGNLDDALDALNEVTDGTREQIGAELQNAEDLWRDAFRMLRDCTSHETADKVAEIHSRILQLIPRRPEPLPSGAAGSLPDLG